MKLIAQAILVIFALSAPISVAYIETTIQLAGRPYFISEYPHRGVDPWQNVFIPAAKLSVEPIVVWMVIVLFAINIVPHLFKHEIQFQLRALFLILLFLTAVFLWFSLYGADGLVVSKVYTITHWGTMQMMPNDYSPGLWLFGLGIFYPVGLGLILFTILRDRMQLLK